MAGVGTGGFEAAYAEQVRGSAPLITHNPHNEYLLISVQVGVLGLVLLLYLMYTQWQGSKNLPSLYERQGARGLMVTLAVSCLFNSSLYDHTEGVFFAFMNAIFFSHLKERSRNV